MTTYYQVEDYNQFIFDGVYGTLTPDIIDIISTLTDEINKIVTQTPVITTGAFHKSSDKYKKSNVTNNNSVNYVKRTKPVKHIVDSDWQTLRVPFKTTQIDKKDGIEKSINDIRICLNKLSNKNYEIQRDLILGLLKTIIEKEIDTEESEEEEKQEDVSEIKRVATSIFDIASNNKFFSEIYAELYKDLIGSYRIFNDIIAEFITKYKNSIYDINYVDPNLEYDKFCDYNKKNDRRKALSAFITNLMKKEIISKDIIIETIILFQNLVICYVDEPNKTNEVEEITENIFILVTSSYSSCNFEDGWEIVMQNIKGCSQMKTKEKVSMSSRAIFKYMDIIDTIKKNNA